MNKNPAKPAIAGVTPSQVTSNGITVTGVDRMDTVDRAKLDPRIKLQLMASECRAIYGVDPRGADGKFSIVGRPRAILQLLIDMSANGFSSGADAIRLQRAMVIGSRDGDADIVGWWGDVPIAVRSTTIDDRLFVMPTEKLPPSIMPDRQQAGRMRMAGHSGALKELQSQ